MFAFESTWKETDRRADTEAQESPASRGVALRDRWGHRLILASMALVVMGVVFSSSHAASFSFDDDEEEELIALYRDDIARGNIDADFLSSLEEEMPNVFEDWRVLALVFDYRVLKGLWPADHELQLREDLNPYERVFAESLDELTKRLEGLSSSQLNVKLRSAQQHERRGRTEAAVERFREILDGLKDENADHDPSLDGDLFLVASEGLVRNLWTIGKRDEAKQVREAAIEEAKSRSDGEALWRVGQMDAAIGRIEDANRKYVYADKAWRNEDEPRHAQLLVSLGDVYRRGRLEGDAVDGLKTLREALEKNPYVEGAHTALAKTYLYREEFGSAMEQVELELLKRPYEPEALALRASFLLRDHHYTDAMDVLEKGLGYNASSKPMLTQLAACSYLSSVGDFRGTMDQVLKIDPHYGEVWSRLGDAVAAHYRFEEAIPLYRRALEINDETHDARIGLGQCLAHTGANEEALEVLDESARLDPFRYPWRTNMRKVLRAYLKYPRIRKGAFAYLMKSDEEAVLLDLLHETLQSAYDDLVDLYGFEPEGPLQIEVYKHHPDWSVRTIGFSGFGALGVCFGRVITLVSPGSEMRGRFVWPRTARHELTHTFSLFYSNLRVPRWFTEGLSVLEESRGRDTWDRDMQIEYYNAYHNGDIAKVADVDQLFRSSRIIFGYYQAGLMCSFIEEKWGYERLKKMLTLYGEDKETDDVIQESFGFEMEEFDRQFMDWSVKTQIEGIKLIPFYSVAKKDALRAQWSKDRENPELCEQLAWAYHRLGRRVDRDRFLDLCLKLDPERGGAHFLLGEREYEKNRMDQAIGHFQAGLEKGADDMFVRLKLSEMYAQKEQFDLMVVQLEAAKNCFPQYVGPGNAYATLAQWYMEDGDEEAAIEQWKTIASLDETDLSVRQRLADFYGERDEKEQQFKYLQEISEIDPFQRRLHVDLGDLHQHFGRYADAIKSWQVALAVDPSMEPMSGFFPTGDSGSDDSVRASIYVRLARMYVELEKFGDAQQAVDDALKRDPENADAKALQETIKQRLDKALPTI